VTRRSDQQHLFPDDWQEHWVGMPEYISEDTGPFASVIIHFRSEDDQSAFFRLIGQIRTKRKSYWYPEVEWRRVADKVYVEEGDE
jgi:hypothetical protein